MNNPARRRFLHLSAAPLSALAGARTGRAGARAPLRVLAWRDYLWPAFLSAYSDATGRPVALSTVSSNAQMLARLRTGEAFDLVTPTHHRARDWAGDLLQPIDRRRVPRLDSLLPVLQLAAERDWRFGGELHWLPWVWGSEGIGWRSDMWTPSGGAPSYGDLWQPAHAGRVMMRPAHGLVGTGLYLERIGELPPGAMRTSFADPDAMHRHWRALLAFARPRRAQFKLYWHDARSQQQALLNQGVLLGHCWDGPPLALRSQGEPVAYRAPHEGALCWCDGLAITRHCRDLDAAYALIDFCLHPQWAGAGMAHHGHNSAVAGAEQWAEPALRSNFRAAYPGRSLQTLWPWPARSTGFEAAQQRFVERLLAP